MSEPTAPINHSSGTEPGQSGSARHGPVRPARRPAYRALAPVVRQTLGASAVCIGSSWLVLIWPPAATVLLLAPVAAGGCQLISLLSRRLRGDRPPTPGPPAASGPSAPPTALEGLPGPESGDRRPPQAPA